MFVVTITFSQSAEDILKLLVNKDIISKSDAEELKKQPETQVRNIMKNSEIFNLAGYGQVICSMSDNATGNAYTNERNSNMQLARAFLVASGKLYKNFGYMLMFDFVKAQIHEYYGEWTPLTEMGVRFGQFKVPLSIENPMSPARWETVFSTRSITTLAGPKAGRDMGFMLSGKLVPVNNKYHLIEYRVGLFNGTGLNTTENNNHKDFAGILLVQPFNGIKIGGSVYSGKGSYDMTGAYSPVGTRDRWTVGGEYDSKYVYSRAEYIWGNDAGLKRDGIYGSIVGKIVPAKWEIVAKYDYFNQNKDIRKVEVNEVTAGVNYYFWPLSRIQLNYIYTDDKFTAATHNTVVAQLQIFF